MSRMGDRSVTCPACGATVSRSAAREYDKFGDRWERRGKRFEYLCKPCHDELCLQDRNGLEALLIDVDAGLVATDAFLSRYLDAVEDGQEPRENR